MEKTNTSPERLQTLGALMNRASLFARLGQQYGGDRNVYEALGYPETLKYEDYAARYERQDIARAVINRPVGHTWKGKLKLTESGVLEDTEMEKAWRTLEMKLQLKSKFIRVDKLSSIGQYGILLLGFDDVKKLPDWSTEVTKGKRDLRYVRPLSEGSAKISTYVTNTKDPRYGKVNTYTVEFTSPAASTTTQTLTVHHSRVVHVTQELLESEIEGVPVLQAIWNRLMDLEKLVGGSAEMFWRGARPGYQGKVKDDYTITADVQAGLEDQLDEFENNLRRMFVNEGIDLEALAPQVADPKEHVDIQIQMISAITGIPKRVLTGSERGELSSDQDIVGWYNIIQTRREEHAEVNIIRPFVDKMIEHEILPPPTTGEYQVQWEDLFAASDKDQAEIGRVRATALREYSQNPVASMIIPPEAFFNLMLGLDEDEIAIIRGMVSENLEEEMEKIQKQLTDPEPAPEAAPEPKPETKLKVAKKE